MRIFNLLKKKKSANTHNIETTASTSDNSMNEHILNIDLEHTGKIMLNLNNFPNTINYKN